MFALHRVYTVDNGHVNNQGKYKSACLIPQRLKTRLDVRLNTILLVLLFSLCAISISGCNADANQGRFELSLLSSVFGDISIPQGKAGTAVVSINRSVESSKYSSNIDMSLIDPPSWLNYTFDENPASGNMSTIRLNIDNDAKPGIYRLILYGAGNTTGKLVEDSVTFHLVIEKVQPDASLTNSSVSLKNKLMSFLNII